MKQKQNEIAVRIASKNPHVGKFVMINRQILKNMKTLNNKILKIIFRINKNLKIICNKLIFRNSYRLNGIVYILNQNLR